MRQTYGNGELLLLILHIVLNSILLTNLLQFILLDQIHSDYNGAEYGIQTE